MELTSQLAVVFKPVIGEALRRAQHLVLSWPAIFGSDLAACDLGYRQSSREFMALARFHDEGMTPALRARFEFWAAESYGRSFALADLSNRDLADFLAGLAHSDFVRWELPQAALSGYFDELASRLHSPVARTPDPRPDPEVVLVVGDSGRVTVDASGTLVIVHPAPPPLGERVRLALHLPGRTVAYAAAARVTQVRQPPRSDPRQQSWFRLSLEDADGELVDALAVWSRRRTQVRELRRSARLDVNLAANTRPVEAIVGPSRRPIRSEQPRRVTFHAAEPLHRDCIQNLSRSGAFLKTDRPLAVASEVRLAFELPYANELELSGTVVRTTEAGAGIAFDLDPPSDDRLALALAEVEQAPMRALLVDGHAESRHELATALAEQGFRVFEAASGAEGSRLFRQDLATLDALITAATEHAEGAALARLIHDGGNDQSLLIALVDEAAPKAGSEASADAVLRRAETPAGLATAIRALVRQRRMSLPG